MRHQVTPSSWCLPFTSVIGLACLGAEELGLDDNQEAFAKAMLQQSRALGTLVSHQEGDGPGWGPKTREAQQKKRQTQVQTQGRKRKGRKRRH